MNIFGWIGLGIALVLVLVLLASCIQIVQQSRAYVVEFLGTFHAVWNVGFHFKVRGDADRQEGFPEGAGGGFCAPACHHQG